MRPSGNLLRQQNSRSLVASTSNLSLLKKPDLESLLTSPQKTLSLLLTVNFWTAILMLLISFSVSSLLRFGGSSTPAISMLSYYYHPFKYNRSQTNTKDHPSPAYPPLLKLFIYYMLQNYKPILEEFQSIGYHEGSMLDQYEVCRALDRIYQKNLREGKEGELFNRDVALEIFEQTDKNEDQEAMLKNFIQTVLQAQQLLGKYIQQAKEKGEDKGTPDEVTQFHQYEEDLYFLTATFNLATPQRKQQALARSTTSSVFQLPSSSQTTSQSLKWALMITMGAVAFELILMFVKPHFIALLAYVAVLSIYLLNYFDRPHVYTTLALLAVSAFLDFLWVILQANHYWNGEAPSHHSTQQTGFLRFVYIMTLLSMLAKGAIIFLLAKFRNNTAQTCKTVRLFNLRFDLSAASPTPVALFFRKSDI